MFVGTDSMFNTESVPSNVSYKSFKTYIYYTRILGINWLDRSTGIAGPQLPEGL
jgi:hypothetical protein